MEIDSENHSKGYAYPSAVKKWPSALEIIIAKASLRHFLFSLASFLEIFLRLLFATLTSTRKFSSAHSCANIHDKKKF
jgi:hypothetical protein